MEPESGFHRRADILLAHLSEAAESQLADHAEVEFQNGILQIEFDDRIFVVSKHAPSRQVWLSSPVSGAWHFSWREEAQAWIDTRQQRELLRLLADEWTGLAGSAVKLAT